MRQNDGYSNTEKTATEHFGTCDTVVRAFLYDTDTFEEIAALDASRSRGGGKLLWVHVEGRKNADLIKRLAQSFDLHPLVVEDMLNSNQRPNLENYGTYLFFVIQAMIESPDKKRFSEQISFAMGQDFVLSIQEFPGEPFTSVYERLKNARGVLRQHGPDFLGHALFDAAIDDSIDTLQKVMEKIDALEDLMVNKPSSKLLHTVHQLRRRLLMLPRTFHALIEITSVCEHADLPLISSSSKPYFRDLHEHLNSLLDTTEMYRSILSGMLDLYLSSMNNRMNEVMKTLTMISTIFIPLSFLAGVYGMNFKYMPELDWEWSYIIFWGMTAGIVFGMLRLFKKKRWL